MFLLSPFRVHRIIPQMEPGHVFSCGFGTVQSGLFAPRGWHETSKRTKISSNNCATVCTNSALVSVDHGYKRLHTTIDKSSCTVVHTVAWLVWSLLVQWALIRRKSTLLRMSRSGQMTDIMIWDFKIPRLYSGIQTPPMAVDGSPGYLNKCRVDAGSIGWFHAHQKRKVCTDSRNT